MERKNLVTTLLAACAALVGCGDGRTHNIGEVGVLGASLTDYAGTWEGYAEAYEFLDGSDNVRVLLNDEGVGVVEVGDTDPLPEPVANEGYPPRSALDDGSRGFFDMGFFGVLAPGFSYPIEAALIETNRIRFETASNALYAEWCALIEPIRDDVNSNQNGNGEVYSCLPNTGFGSMQAGNEEVCYLHTDDGEEPIACGLLTCLSVCHCDAEGCAVYEGEPDIRFDGALQAQGEELEGTLVMGDRITLRLTRQ